MKCVRKHSTCDRHELFVVAVLMNNSEKSRALVDLRQRSAEIEIERLRRSCMHDDGRGGTYPSSEENGPYYRHGYRVGGVDMRRHYLEAIERHRLIKNDEIGGSGEKSKQISGEYGLARIDVGAIGAEHPAKRRPPCGMGA